MAALCRYAKPPPTGISPPVRLVRPKPSRPPHILPHLQPPPVLLPRRPPAYCSRRDGVVGSSAVGLWRRTQGFHNGVEGDHCIRRRRGETSGGELHLPIPY